MAQIKKKWLKGVGQAGGLAELDANGVVPVAQLPAAVTGEAQAREDADALLSGRLDALELDPVTKTYVDQKDGDVLDDAKDYADQKISDLKGAVSVDFDTLKKIEDKINFITSNVDGAALDSLSEIVSAFQSADSTINGAITSLANSAAADVDAEESARIAADAQVLSDAKAYADGLEALDLRLDGSRAMTGGLQSKDVTPIANSTYKLGSSANNFLEAYVNTVYSGNLRKGSAGVLNIATQGSAGDIKIQANAGSAIDFSNSRMKNVPASQASTDAVNRGELDAALLGIVKAVWHKKKIVLTSTDLSNGYIDLDHTALANCIQVFVNRVAVHETDDYSISVVGGKTRLTFVGEIAVGGISQLEVDDVIRITYQYE